MADPIRGLETDTRKRQLDGDNDDVSTKKRRLDGVFEEHSYASTSRMTNADEYCENLTYGGYHSSHGNSTDEDQNRITNLPSDVSDDIISISSSVSRDNDMEIDIVTLDEDQNEIPNSPLAVVDDIISISSMESVRSYNEVESDTESTSSGYVTGTCGSITDEEQNRIYLTPSAASFDTRSIPSTESVSSDMESDTESTSSGYVTGIDSRTTNEDQNESTASSSSSSDDVTIYISSTENESDDTTSILSVESVNSDYVTIGSTTDEDQNESSDDDVIYVSTTERV